jgi:septum formation protein
MAWRLATEKSRAISATYPQHVVIGSDQVADWQGQALGKPGTREAACAQLAKVSGQVVVFHTAVSVSIGDQRWTASTATRCCFRTLDEKAIHRYVDIDNPIDTAGSAKAESLGIALMESMHSDDPTAIIGLPLIALTTLLRKAGLDPLKEHPVQDSMR